jgi:hypothetical protein
MKGTPLSYGEVLERKRWSSYCPKSRSSLSA